MNSFILITSDTKQQQDFLNKFYSEHSISVFDRVILTDEGNMGISLIRELQEKLYLAPYQGKVKCIIFFNAHRLTIEAQNALLKILEEPPAFVYCILITNSSEPLLPTILSRCQVIKPKETEKHEELTRELEDAISICLSGTIGAKLLLAEKISTDKKGFTTFVTQMVRNAREQLLQDYLLAPAYIPLLIKLQKSYDLSQSTNVNLRILSEHMLFTL